VAIDTAPSVPDRGGPDLVVGPTGIEAALDRLFARQRS